MKETKTMMISVAAVILSAIAIVSSVILRPTLVISAGAVGTDELANNSVTSDKIVDGVIADTDLISTGISRIADNSITLDKLTPDTKAEIENIADNSITSAKIADEAIVEADLATEVENRLGKAATLIVAADGSGDYTDIQSAVDNLPSGGGVVYIREGTYTLSSSISIKSNVALIGASAATKLFLADGANADVIRAFNVKNIVIADLSIDGNRGNQTLTVDGIQFRNVENSRISGCWIENSRSDGIYLDTSSNNIITNNVVGLNGSSGIGLYSESNNNVVEGNIARVNGLAGITINTSSYNAVTGNTIELNGQSGIYFYPSSYNTIIGNTIASNGYQGIYLYSSSNNVVTGNAITNNSHASAGTYDGIDIYTSDYNVITSNRCTDDQGTKTQRYGVSITDAASDKNLVATNVLIGNRTGSLNDAGTGTVSANNITA